MKRFLPFLLLLAAGCISSPARNRGGEAARTETGAERDARELAYDSFMQLHKAWLEGDAMASLYMMSVQGISDWLLTRTRDTGDPDWSKQLARMEPPTRVEFDAWVRRNKRVQIPISEVRAEGLPQSVLDSKWLRETWTHYFDLEKATLRRIAEAMQVSSDDVYVEGVGMSVLVRVNRTPTHIYSMVAQDAAWKFDYAVRPANRVK